MIPLNCMDQNRLGAHDHWAKICLNMGEQIQDKVGEGKLHSYGSKNGLEEQVQKILFFTIV